MPPETDMREAHWSLDLLGHLEWHRFQELVGRLLHRAGYLPEVAWIRPDGGTALLLEHPARPGKLEAVVQCAPWLAGDIGTEALHQLNEVVRKQGARRGIYITPGIFQPEARSFVRMKPLELVDGSDLLTTLQRLPSEERACLLRMSTVGPWLIPTCPACLTGMELVDNAAAAQGQRTADLIYKDRRIEAGEVDCRSLTLKRKAEITFMKSVTTGAMTVQGKATGNIVVNGRLHVMAGGCVSGLVSARSIQLDPGGTLEADAKILNESDLPHLRPMPNPQVWRCPAFPKCRITLPAR